MGSLNLVEIASWQLPNLNPSVIDSENIIRAALPALQRGSVWKPQQTEKLWDSLLRGFPVGAFLLSRYNDDRYGKQEFKLDKSHLQDSIQATHHLLDGQQRATSIALGFFDIWELEFLEERKDGPTIWIDLAPAPDKDDREFVLRVITRSHPWGYKRTSSEEKLETAQMRKALGVFQQVAPPEYQAAKPSDLPLRYTWPWDAQAPIPLAFLIKAIRTHATDVVSEVRKELERLHFWSDALSDNAVLRGDVKLKEVLLAALNGTDPNLRHRLDLVINALRPLVAEKTCYGIPALILPESTTSSEAVATVDEPVNERPDAVETLFVRVNSGGTRLEGEELIYSLLKSAWKDAPQAIKNLQPEGHHLLPPARTVLLVTRLLLAREQRAENEERCSDPPPTPDVARFRRLLGENGRKEKMKIFVGSHEAKSIFDTAFSVLALDKNSNIETYRLPPSLLATLTQGETGADIILLFLCWLDRMIMAKLEPKNSTPQAKKKLLGFLTAMAWFSRDSSRCLRRLWPELQRCPIDKLPDFFNRTHFQLLFPPDRRAGLILLPIIPPDVLEKAIKDRVTSGDGFKQASHEFWKAGRWSHWDSALVTEEFGQLNGAVKGWLRALPVSDDSNEESSNREDRNEVLRAAWGEFLDRLWYERRLLQYAQRDWLLLWFPHFDPGLPDQMEDINRPWDYDHIHPHNFIAGKRDIPSVVRDWHQSIGNLRAWPLELNRADQDSVPRHKLVLSGDDAPERRYEILKDSDLLAASFIAKEDKAWWEGSVPEENNSRYLARPKGNDHDCRMALLRAITSRFCRLYREWYDTLHVGKLHS